MKKTAEWFEHAKDFHSSPFGMALTMKYGNAGYGLYYKLFEKLTGEPERTLKADEDSILILAHLFVCRHNDEIKLLKDIITAYFQTDGDFFWSDELNDLLARYDEKTIKQSEGGKTGAANMTPEARKERSKKANAAKKAKAEVIEKVEAPNSDLSNLGAPPNTIHYITYTLQNNTFTNTDTYTDTNTETDTDTIENTGIESDNSWKDAIALDYDDSFEIFVNNYYKKLNTPAIPTDDPDIPDTATELSTVPTEKSYKNPNERTIEENIKYCEERIAKIKSKNPIDKDALEIYESSINYYKKKRDQIEQFI